MKSTPTLFVLIYRLCLLAYPREFQTDCAAEMVATLQVRDAEERKRRGLLGRLRFRFRELRAVVRTGLRLRFGGHTPLPNPAGSGPREPHWRGFVDSVAQDVRHGWRGWRRSPLVAAVAVATLGMGIGATTSIFSVIDSVLLRGISYRQQERLVQIINTLPEADIWFTAMSPDELESWRLQRQVFDGIEGYAAADFVVTEDGEPRRLAGARVTVGLLDFLGIRPRVGRGFGADDAAPAGERVAMISEGMWRRRFGASPSIVGTRVVIDGEPHTIVGVVPRGFHLPSQRAQLWLPLRPSESTQSTLSLTVLARLPFGVDLARGQELAEVAAESLKQEGRRREDWGIQLRAKSDDRASAQTKESLYVLAGAVGFVLLISCANIANLALARATMRRRELTLRAALGAGRRRIVRQVLTESILVALLGGTLGVLLAFWLLGAMTRWAPAELTVLSESAIEIDLRVLAFATAISLLAGLVSGLMPAIRGSRPHCNHALARAGGTAVAGGGRNRLRGALVVAEVGSSLVLLIGAGLMIGSFVRLNSIAPGFATDNLLVIDLELDPTRYTSDAQRQAFFDDLVDMASALPGAEAVTVAVGAPPQGGIVEVGMNPEAEGLPITTAGSAFFARTMVTPSYFRTMRMPLLQGRSFVADEGAAVVINATLARRYWGDDSPVGRRLRLGEEEPWLTVVGVVDDVSLRELGEYGELQIYYPLAADTEITDHRIVVRATADPLGLAPAVKSQIQTLDPDLPIDGIATMEDLYYESLATPRFYLWLMGVFAAVAAALAAIGIYGVTAYTVGQRTREIGVRIALGARRADVLRLVLGGGLVQVLAGVILGLAGAVALSRVLANMLFEVPPTDPATYAAVSVLLIATALIACYIPARRATRADPLQALRD